MISEDPLETTFNFCLSTRKKKASIQKTLFISFDTGCNFRWKGYVNMAGKLPQLDCKPRAFFACNTNCAKCHPKRLLLLDSPAAIRSLNYLSWPAEDCLSAAHGLPRKPFATRLQRLSADEEAHEWSVALCCLPEQSPGATGGTEMLSLLPSTPKAKPRLQRLQALAVLPTEGHEGVQVPVLPSWYILHKLHGKAYSLPNYLIAFPYP